MVKHIFVTSTLATALALTGCAQSRSTAIDIAEFYAAYSVSATGSGQATCSAEFNVGGSSGTYIVLDGDDKVSCSNGTDSETLKGDEGLFNEVSYSGKIATVSGGTYTFTLTKEDKTYTANIALPAPISISSPTSGATFTRGAPINVLWNAGNGDSVTVWLSYKAAGSPNSSSIANYVTDDTGSYTVPGADTTLEGITGAVDVTIGVSRSSNSKSVGEELKGGTISAHQSSATVTGSMP